MMTEDAYIVNVGSDREYEADDQLVTLEKEEAVPQGNARSGSL